MTIPVNTTFRVHAAEGDHKALFNFVGPRSRRWAKKQRGIPAVLPATTPPKEVTAGAAPLTTTNVTQPPAPQPVVPPPTPSVVSTPPAAVAAGRPVITQQSKVAEGFWKHAGSEPWNWNPWELMAEQGYKPEDMTESTGFGDPRTEQRLMPYMERFKGDPKALQAFIRANMLHGDYAEKYRETMGDPNRSKSIWNRFSWNPQAATLSPENLQRGYQQALQQATARLEDEGYPTSRAANMARLTLGTPEDFAQRVTGQINEKGVTGIGPGDIAPWALLGGAPIAIGAKALELGTSDAARGYFGGDADAQQRQQRRMEDYLQRDAEKGTTGTGLWDLVSSPLGGLLGGQGGIDEGSAGMAAGLEKMRTLGTVQNRIRAENLRRKNQLGYSADQSGIESNPLLSQTAQTPEDLEGAKRRNMNSFLGRGGDASRQGWSAFQAANVPGYHNLATLDMFPFGEMSGVESARSARKWEPLKGNVGEFGGYLKDMLTGGDTSHDYLMKGEDTSFDEPGAGRFQPYQQASKMLQKGKFDPRYDSLQGLKLRDPGKPFAAIDPRNWLMGWQRGESTGPVSAQQFSQDVMGDTMKRMRSGQLAERDVSQMESNLQKNPDYFKTLDWAGAKKDWRTNRPRGDIVTRQMELNANPEPFVKENAERWAKTAGPYEDFEARQTASRGYSLEDYQKYQRALLLKMKRQRDMSRAQYFGRDPREHAYGKGLYERWHDMHSDEGLQNPLAFLGGVMSNRDIQALDPVLSQQREEVMAGRWRPGMEIDPLIQRNTMGWTNPLGQLSEYLGFAKGPKQREQELMSGVQKSPEYQKLIGDRRKGLISRKDFRLRAPGVPATEYQPGMGDINREGDIAQAKTDVSSFGELINNTDKALSKESPLSQVWGY